MYTGSRQIPGFVGGRVIDDLKPALALKFERKVTAGFVGHRRGDALTPEERQRLSIASTGSGSPNCWPWSLTVIRMRPFAMIRHKQSTARSAGCGVIANSKVVFRG